VEAIGCQLPRLTRIGPNIEDIPVLAISEETARTDSVASFSCNAMYSGMQGMNAPVSASAFALTGANSGALGVAELDFRTDMSYVD